MAGYPSSFFITKVTHATHHTHIENIVTPIKGDINIQPIGYTIHDTVLLKNIKYKHNNSLLLVIIQYNTITCYGAPSRRSAAPDDKRSRTDGKIN